MHLLCCNQKIMHLLCCVTAVADKNTAAVRRRPPHAAAPMNVNDNVGNGICGILYKWVNFGKGWRPRWFVLHDGVLSYYKIHGHKKIVINLEMVKGFNVLGKKSFRFINSSKSTPHKSLSRKPLGEILLKVSSVMGSCSDERRFLINVGKKKLHLRAETKEDRLTWLEGLVAAKKSYLTSDFVHMPRMNTNCKVATQESKMKGRNTSGSYEEQYKQAETGDDVYTDNLFFDAKDFLSSSSLRSTEPYDESSSSDSENEEVHPSEDGLSSFMRFVESDYPYVKRREKLPDPVEEEKGVSLWSMIKDNIGKDLTRVCLPVYFNEPLSSLQKCFEDFEFSYLLDQAYEWGKTGNSLMRMLNVAAFAVSGYACTDGRKFKPFNPLLGETYEANYPDKGLRFISEKVSHHPLTLACHCEGRGWKMWGDTTLKNKFWGPSIQLDPVGVLNLEFDDGEVFRWSKVTTSIYNLILGKLYCEHYGMMHIEGNGDYSCKLKFKKQSIMNRNPHQVHGVVQDRSGKTVATMFGKWDESLHYCNGDSSSTDLGQDKAYLLWKRSKPSEFQTKYNFTCFAITLNELSPDLEQEKLPPTDSRLRPDQRFLENGEYEIANSEKLRLEQRQRQASKMQERGWTPRWFTKPKGRDTYQYKGGYWDVRETGKWESCPHIFGEVSDEI
ncbi:oxysterol-binding protein-related protein 1B-like isoform X3 [Nicotiana tomentosiformis]|uniref:oxysterol-binding protein-related protein 1B-like isoform X3 n=1 Tax=Nicotiana tomentosiformis TaxID=4098 RepID=UPI001444D29F|nr:oxysterol-binding protein-related protein 1B-like isoform X4 [Nicotiana tomentosiformis]